MVSSWEIKKYEEKIKENIKNFIEEDIIINKTSKYEIKTQNKFEKLKIFIKENCNVELYEEINLKNSIKKIEIYLEKNSKLNLNQLNLNSNFIKLDIYLKENSTLRHNIINISSQNSNYIYSKIHFLEKNSKGETKIILIAKEKSNILCDGIIKIYPDAKKSEGKLKLKGLLFDENSSIQNEPILEIQNNDVICSHSASISSIDKEELYFLESRGLREEDIKDLIITGFINSIKNEL